MYSNIEPDLSKYEICFSAKYGEGVDQAMAADCLVRSAMSVIEMHGLQQSLRFRQDGTDELDEFWTGIGIDEVIGNIIISRSAEPIPKEQDVQIWVELWKGKKSLSPAYMRSLLLCCLSLIEEWTRSGLLQQDSTIVRDPTGYLEQKDVNCISDYVAQLETDRQMVVDDYEKIHAIITSMFDVSVPSCIRPRLGPFHFLELSLVPSVGITPDGHWFCDCDEDYPCIHIRTAWKVPEKVVAWGLKVLYGDVPRSMKEIDVAEERSRISTDSILGLLDRLPYLIEEYYETLSDKGLENIELALDRIKQLLHQKRV